MTAPLSRDRVLAAMRRLSPPWPDAGDDTSVGKELGSIATALGMAADRLDVMLDEIFPLSTEELIERWENVTRNPVRSTDSIAARRARVLSVLRRTSGPRIEQLSSMLAGPLALDVEDIIFIEMTRDMIEQALTVADTTGWPLGASPVSFDMGQPWPGIVDDTGVKLYVKLSAFGTPDIALESPDGTLWPVPVNGAEGTYATRLVFGGNRAGGPWRIIATDATGPTLEEVRLFVSNDVDSAQIYNFFAFRDPALAGTPNIADAQRLFRRTALAHMNSHVIESMAFTVGDSHSLCGRDPVGV